MSVKSNNITRDEFAAPIILYELFHLKSPIQNYIHSQK